MGKPFVSIKKIPVVPSEVFSAVTDPDKFGKYKLEKAIAVAYYHWVKLGQTKLFTSSQEYVAGIQKPEIKGMKGYIVLTGTLPNMVEQGIEAFDLRSTVLGPTSQHRKKIMENGLVVGYYQNIPFRHGNPQATGRNFLPLGAAYSADRELSNRFPHEVLVDAMSKGKQLYKYAKDLQPGEYLVDDIFPKLRPHHKTSIYTGMIRAKAAYASTIQHHYVTFRTISTRVKTGWIHPGIQARKLAEQVVVYVGKKL